MTHPIDPATDLGPRLVVWHAAGHTVYNTTVFSVDDKSAVLLVFQDRDRRKALAAFNREFWVHADIVEHRDLGPLLTPPEGGDSDATGEVRAPS